MPTVAALSPRPRSTHRSVCRYPILLALCVAPYAGPALAQRDVICVGDCNYDRRTSVDELVTGVAISLNQQEVASCVGVDPSGDQQVTVDEVIGAVRNALDGCPAARFEPTACAAAPPVGQEPQHVVCGDLLAPEDRGAADGRTVRLAVMVLTATGAAPRPDPMVFLGGGPGGKLLEAGFRQYTPEFAAPLQTTRDLVFFDQRGAGRSRPSLDCPEYAQGLAAAYATAGTAADDAAATLAALRACHDRLIAEGINLAAYTSADSAADLDDLMTALGYGQWNVYGISYGTRLALTAMRDRPAPIRSVILDSTVPVQASLDASFAADFEHALDTLFAGCAASPSCAAAFPGLEQSFFELVDRLDAAPVTLRPVDAVTGQPFDVVLTGQRLLFAIQQALYRTDFIPILPQLIASAAADDYALLTFGYASLTQTLTGIAQGMTYSIWCGEEVPFTTPEIVAAATAGVRPVIRDMGLTLITQLRLDACAFWDVPAPAAVENQAVTSDIPTLVLAGEYDPITPPYHSAAAAQTLSRSQLLAFRGFGHGVLRAQSSETARPRCAMRVVGAFLDDPLAIVDAACVDALAPAFSD